MRRVTALLLVLSMTAIAEAQATRPAVDRLLAGDLKWVASRPLLAPLDRDGDHYYSVKDPSVVQFGGKWHVFATVRGQKRSHQIEYFAFDDWEKAERGERHMLPITDDYVCAPQVFYFTPQKKWYLVYQVREKGAEPELRPAFSTNNSRGFSSVPAQGIRPPSPCTMIVRLQNSSGSFSTKISKPNLCKQFTIA